MTVTPMLTLAVDDRAAGSRPTDQPAEAEAPLIGLLRVSNALDLRWTLGPLRHGSGDPSVRFGAASIWRATRTPDGPATMRLAMSTEGVEAMVWGPGREWAMDAIPRLIGEQDRPADLRPAHAVVRELQRRFAGLRFGRTDALLEALVPAVIEQKVTGTEARRSYRALLLAKGEAAPGPAGLVLPPSAEALHVTPYYGFHPFGLEQRRALTLRRLGAPAAHLDKAATLPPADALAYLRSIPGIGPWTAAEAARVALGDADAVSVGDLHVPNLVCWALAGEPRGDDQRMLELLEPYRGQRARVVRLLELSGIRAPRYGPRLAPRSIARI